MKVAPALQSWSSHVHLEGLSGRDPGVAEWKAMKRGGHHRGRRKSVNSLEDLNDVLKRTVINKCYYPMYAVKIEDFLKFKPTDSLEHQSLLRRNLLTMWSPGKGPCAFVSHQCGSFGAEVREDHTPYSQDENSQRHQPHVASSCFSPCACKGRLGRTLIQSLISCQC